MINPTGYIPTHLPILLERVDKLTDKVNELAKRVESLEQLRKPAQKTTTKVVVAVPTPKPKHGRKLQ